MLREYRVCVRSEESVDNIVAALGYYAVQMKGEIDRWFRMETYNGRTWVRMSLADQEFRRNLLEFAVGIKLSDKLFGIDDLGLIELGDIVGECKDRLDAYIDSPMYCNLPKDPDDLPPSRYHNSIEDIAFYCCELLRGLEAAYRLEQLLEQYSGKPVIPVHYGSIADILEDTIGTVIDSE